jgi:hypothetical protein
VTFRRFGFEDADPELAFIPLDLRRKLDLAGRRLSLAAWQELSGEVRRGLCEATPEALAGLDCPSVPPASPWRSPDAAGLVAARAAALKLAFDPACWDALDDASRYALHKLADPRRDGEKLARALAELCPPCQPL